MKTLIKLFLLIAILHIFFAGCNSKDSSSSDSSEDELETAIVTADNTATTAPVIAEVTAVTTPTNDTTPDYTFSSDEAGTITYGGSCSSSTTSATTGNNTISLVSLSDGTYSNCTITVTDSGGNVSNSLAITSFTVAIPPIIAEVTAVTTPTNDTTPNYTFSSSKAGTITYGGSCSSSSTIAIAGINTITFNALVNGTYDNCTITVTDNSVNRGKDE
jgi:heat shock protein HslJ